ncbi:MAG TPA: DUF6799 domain-containing protein [Chthoniobacteraceae bacterium]|jgi:hypothetical protein
MNLPLSTAALVVPVLSLALAGCSTTPESGSSPEGTSQGTMVANTDSSSVANAGTAQTLAGDPEGIVRQNGRLYYLKDGGRTLISGRQRVTPGLYLENNGDVTTAEGRRVKLREGSMVTLGGEVREAPRMVR